MQCSPQADRPQSCTVQGRLDPSYLRSGVRHISMQRPRGQRHGDRGMGDTAPQKVVAMVSRAYTLFRTRLHVCVPFRGRLSRSRDWTVSRLPPPTHTSKLVRIPTPRPISPVAAPATATRTRLNDRCAVRERAGSHVGGSSGRRADGSCLCHTCPRRAELSHLGVGLVVLYNSSYSGLSDDSLEKRTT